MIDLILNNPYVLAINFHSGALVVNYPWNDGRVRLSTVAKFSELLDSQSLRNGECYFFKNAINIKS
jgi:hypothetical protein